MLTHALNYGTGVFAGLRGYWNAEEPSSSSSGRTITSSASSIRRGCSTWTLPYTADTLDRGTRSSCCAPSSCEDCYARPLAFYADETIGVRLHNLTPEVSMVALPYGRYFDNDDGVHATISSWRRVDDNMIPPARQDRRFLRQLGVREDRTPSAPASTTPSC